MRPSERRDLQAADTGLTDRKLALTRQFTRQQARRRQITAEYARGEHNKQDCQLMPAASDKGLQETQTALSELHAKMTAGLFLASAELEEVWDASTIYWKPRSVSRRLTPAISRRSELFGHYLLFINMTQKGDNG